MNQKYFGEFSSYESVLREFQITAADLKPSEVVFASYGCMLYEGSAVVIFERGGKLFEVGGGHCSCYGLEGQWKPGPVTWKALAMREPARFLRDHKPEAVEAFTKLVNRNTARKAA